MARAWFSIFAVLSVGLTGVASFGRYATSYPGWAALLASSLMTGGIGVVAVGVMNRYFARAVAKSLQQAEALEQSQREYRDIFENMVDTVYRADMDGEILTISPRS